MRDNGIERGPQSIKIVASHRRPRTATTKHRQAEETAVNHCRQETRGDADSPRRAVKTVLEADTYNRGLVPSYGEERKMAGEGDWEE